MPLSTIDQLQELFHGFGVDAIYVKHLSPKQDNDKNQIYLGSGLDGVVNLFPAEISVRSASESLNKRKSEAGKPKLEAKIDLAWIGDDGAVCPAPDARIIDYFQYPEIRLSGFLEGCKSPPDALRRRNQAGYGKRILALGLAPSGRVLGRVLTERDDPLVGVFPELPELASAPILRVLAVGAPAGATPLGLLRVELASIIEAGWHRSVILKPGASGPVPFSGAQGAGYTLEALLGVAANASKAPDKYGFEVKSYSGARISLMTPTPDGGYQGDHTFREFMERYGHAGVKDDGSRRFTGIHRCGVVNNRTGIELRVNGYDPATGKFADNTEEIAVQLVAAATGDVVASWSLEHLANSWNKKHASAIYIPVSKREAGGGTSDSMEYSYGPTALVGQGTDVWKLLRAIHAGAIYYDPADSIYADGRAKVRSQWRINSSGLKEAMKTLYASVEEIRP